MVVRGVRVGVVRCVRVGAVRCVRVGCARGCGVGLRVGAVGSGVGCARGCGAVGCGVGCAKGCGAVGCGVGCARGCGVGLRTLMRCHVFARVLHQPHTMTNRSQLLLANQNRITSELKLFWKTLLISEKALFCFCPNSKVMFYVTSRNGATM